MSSAPGLQKVYESGLTDDFMHVRPWMLTGGRSLWALIHSPSKHLLSTHCVPSMGWGFMTSATLLELTSRGRGGGDGQRASRSADYRRAVTQTKGAWEGPSEETWSWDVHDAGPAGKPKRKCGHWTGRPQKGTETAATASLRLSQGAAGKMLSWGSQEGSWERVTEEQNGWRGRGRRGGCEERQQVSRWVKAPVQVQGSWRGGQQCTGSLSAAEGSLPPCPAGLYASWPSTWPAPLPSAQGSCRVRPTRYPSPVCSLKHLWLRLTGGNIFDIKTRWHNRSIFIQIFLYKGIAPVFSILLCF